MKKIYLEEKYVLEYIRDMLNSFKKQSVEINDAIYHHNTSYFNATLLIKYGILTILDLKELGIRKYSDKELKIFDDVESHVNGTDAVSLSVVGLTDLYPHEIEYNPFKSSTVDFCISSDIKVCRLTQHYGNEYLHFGKIETDKFKSIDIRLLQLIAEKKETTSIEEIILRYNCIKDIAIAMKQFNLDIPFRDMSNDNLTLDIDKVSNTPKILLK